MKGKHSADHHIAHTFALDLVAEVAQLVNGDDGIATASHDEQADWRIECTTVDEMERAWQTKNLGRGHANLGERVAVAYESVDGTWNEQCVLQGTALRQVLLLLLHRRSACHLHRAMAFSSALIAFLARLDCFGSTAATPGTHTGTGTVPGTSIDGIRYNYITYNGTECGTVQSIHVHTVYH